MKFNIKIFKFTAVYNKTVAANSKNNETLHFKLYF